MVIPAGLVFSNVFMIATVVAALYFAREVLVPIALAVLLTFILAPVVGFLQRLHFPKVLAVASAVVLAFVILLSLGTMVMTQVSQLANDLPKYQFTLREKAHNLRAYLGGAGVLKSASDVLKDLNQELNKDDKSIAGKPSSAEASPPVKPVPVEIHQPEPAASETLIAIMRPLVSPLTTTGIVVIFVIFFLFQREDLRNRFIRLTGTADLERTTTALDDAGYRLTRLFATQLALNACFGTVLGVGLFLIGVPSAPLWGLLAMILRFVPYVGPALAAVLPLTLAAAVGNDWSMVLWTAALFGVVEPLTGHVVEPLVSGKSAGLSPVAIVTAAAFWTWLWGPLGLILSTPITVCLVVVARHVERLKFIDVLLGDEPALTPQQANYQRMLAADAVEIVDHGIKCLKEKSLIEYCDEVLLGALRLGEQDAKQGRLDNERLDNILQTVTEVIEELHEEQSKRNQAAAKEEANRSGGNVVPLRERNSGRSVLCVPGLGRLDSAAALILAEALNQSGIEASASRQPLAVSSETPAPKFICVCFLEDISGARIRFAQRKMARASAGAKAFVVLLNKEPSRKANGPAASSEAEPILYSIQEAIAEFSTSVKPAEAEVAEPSTL
jgi:predicted PurR-regulated permease PerM